MIGTYAGKTAHYMLRWVMSDGSVGAWGKSSPQPSPLEQ